MALHFILGRAGAGKTTWCVNAAREAMLRDPWGPPLILLVPEQATHQTERALLAGEPRGGDRAAVRARVLSFRRLAAGILGGAAGGRIIDATGRHMLLASIIEELRDQLGPFAASARRPGFAMRLAATLAELTAQRAAVDALEASAGRLDRTGVTGERLAGKLDDVARVWRAYRQRIEGLYLDPQEILDLAADRIASARWLRGAQVWVDGFAGLTPQEYSLLGRIASEVQDVWVALCLDPDDLSGARSRLFAPTVTTYWRLRTLAAEHGLTLGQTDTLPHPGGPTRYDGAPALSHLERAFGGEQHWPVDAGKPGEAPGRLAAAVAPPPAQGAIRLVAAPDERREVASAAAEMMRLSREAGYAWREMALVVPDLEAYHDLLRLTLEDYGIPAFIDRRRPVPYHPLIELLRSSIEIAQHNWRAEDVLRWLKTDMGPLDRDGVDVLENYVLAHGLRGRRAWCGPAAWAYWSSGSRRLSSESRASLLQAVNESRRSVAGCLAAPCLGLETARSEPQPVAALVAALMDMLEQTGAGATLARWAQQAQAAGRPEQAQEHVEVWRQVTSVLAQAYSALGDRTMVLEQFAAVVEAGLESLALGLVPPSLDQVVCGTIERSRQPALKAMFVLGASQGAFPGRPAEDAVFDDAERTALAGAGLTLADTARQRSFHEEYLTYIAVTRSSEYLWISWPERSGAKEGAGPSPLVARLRLMFPDLAVETPAELQSVWRPAQLARGLAKELSGLRERIAPRDEWLDAYQWMATRAVDRQDHLAPEHKAFAAALAGLDHSNRGQALGPALSRQMWDRPVRGSASRFERFEACAFAHFAAYGLQLAPRAKQELRAPQMGTFYHAALQAYYRHLTQDGIAPGSLSPEQVSARLAVAVEETAPLLGNEMLMTQGRYRYLQHILHRTLERTVGWLGQHDQRSAFRPVGLEQGFGFELSATESVDIAGISLRGVIDRLDLAETPDGRKLLRIIDYKSGRRKYGLADVAHGIELQLLTYLLAVETVACQLGITDAEVAALLLFPVQDPMLPAAGPVDPDAERKRIKQWQPSGLILADPDVLQALDQGIQSQEETAAPLFAARLNKAGAVSGSGVATREQFALLARYVASRIASIGAQLAEGVTAIRPWRRGQSRACAHCDYHAVCGFDPRLPGNRYRDLPALSQSAAWAEIGRIAAGGEVYR